MSKHAGALFPLIACLVCIVQRLVRLADLLDVYKTRPVPGPYSAVIAGDSSASE